MRFKCNDRMYRYGTPAFDNIDIYMYTLHISIFKYKWYNDKYTLTILAFPLDIKGHELFTWIKLSRFIAEMPCYHFGLTKLLRKWKL